MVNTASWGTSRWNVEINRILTKLSRIERRIDDLEGTIVSMNIKLRELIQ